MKEPEGVTFRQRNEPTSVSKSDDVEQTFGNYHADENQYDGSPDPMPTSVSVASYSVLETDDVERSSKPAQNSHGRHENFQANTDVDEFMHDRAVGDTATLATADDSLDDGWDQYNSPRKTLASVLSLGFKKECPAGAWADKNELEYIAALHQTEWPNLRRDGSIRGMNHILFLTWRSFLFLSDTNHSGRDGQLLEISIWHRDQA